MSNFKQNVIKSKMFDIFKFMYSRGIRRQKYVFIGLVRAIKKNYCVKSF